MVPTFTCGLSRSNFCFANSLAPHLLLSGVEIAHALGRRADEPSGWDAGQRGNIAGTRLQAGSERPKERHPATKPVGLPADRRPMFQAVAPTGVPLRCSVISSARDEGISA